jgi:hypothetical protein
MDIWDIILTIVITALGVTFALWYENLGSPRLIILPDATTEDKKMNELTTRFLHLKVKNDPKNFPAVPKQTAFACHGNITFLTDKFEEIGKSIQYKWDGTPEPINPEILNRRIVYLTDNRLIRTTRFIDIPPGEEESLAIAFRIKGDSEAYGWSYLNYQHSDWRHPGSILPSGNYVARITITSGDTVVKKDIPFTNPENFEEFDLVITTSSIIISKEDEKHG